MSVREEHIVNLKGKRFVTYEGLLALSHERGLEEINTGLEQLPAEGNGNTAIATATVRIRSANGGAIQSFSGIGDASPENVSRGVSAHLIRVAETRAKARALRDAVNVSEALMDDESTHVKEPHNSPVSNSRPEPNPQYQKTGGYPQQQEQAPQGEDSGRSEAIEDRNQLPATRKQLNYLETLIEEVVEDGLAKFEEMVGKKLNELTREEASEWISRLSGRAA